MSKTKKQPNNEVDSQILIDHHPSRFGTVILILILILFILLVALYIWSRAFIAVETTEALTPTRPTAEENNEPESNNAEAETTILDVFSTSDELSAIEADLSATDLSNLNADLNAIDAELRSE